MAKVMIHFKKNEIEYLAALVAIERDEYLLDNRDSNTAKYLGNLHGRLISCCVNGDCEVVING